VDDLSISELSVAQYAREHGLSARSLAWWRWKLGERRHGPERATRAAARTKQHRVPLSFVPVRVVAEPAVTAMNVALQVVLSGGRRIEIKSGFDGDTLARLILVLEALAC
jgi:transposase-like protein